MYRFGGDARASVDLPRCYIAGVIQHDEQLVPALAPPGPAEVTEVGSAHPEALAAPRLAPGDALAPAPRPVRRKSGGAIIAALGFLLMKAKSLLVLLKALPAAKLLLTSVSMVLMVAFEAQRSGWWFGVGFVLMLLVHELGHGYAMKKEGMHAGWPIFIPFFGAMIAMKNAPRSRDSEATIAYGGPLAGTLVSVLAALLGLTLDSRLLVALAYTGFFLNLFNLTPISPLDGGRVAQAFSRRAWFVGLGVLGGIFLWTHSPQLLLIGALALPRLFGKAAARREEEREALEPGLQRLWAARYFGLAAFLGTGMYLSGSLLGES
jgi:Zn-dependent protease